MVTSPCEGHAFIAAITGRYPAYEFRQPAGRDEGPAIAAVRSATEVERLGSDVYGGSGSRVSPAGRSLRRLTGPLREDSVLAPLPLDRVLPHARQGARSGTRVCGLPDAGRRACPPLSARTKDPGTLLQLTGYCGSFGPVGALVRIPSLRW